MKNNTAAKMDIDQETTKTAPSFWQIPRRLYNWVLSWAETKYGAPALFVIAFVESSVFPIPPDVLLVALVLGARSRWLKFSLICTLGSALGGLAGYAVGMFFMTTIGQWVIEFYSAQAAYSRVTAWYDNYDYWIVFIAAFTPIPYKVFTIASGAFGMNVLGFFAVSVVGRGMRFMIVSYLLYRYGEPIKRFIDRYFDVLCLAFVVILAAGFMALKYI